MAHIKQYIERVALSTPGCSKGCHANVKS